MFKGLPGVKVSAKQEGSPNAAGDGVNALDFGWIEDVAKGFAGQSEWSDWGRQRSTNRPTLTIVRPFDLGGPFLALHEARLRIWFPFVKS